MNQDLTPLLQELAYAPEKVTARLITGEQGTPKLQMRVDLGILQLELSGRPDGTRPHGCTSLLHYYRRREATERGQWKIDAEACGELQREAAQYYYRYLCHFSLKHYQEVIDDTDHNQDMIDLAARRAENEELAWEFMQYKPYVIMMNTRARVELALQDGDHAAAEAAARSGLERIDDFWTNETDADWLDDCPEAHTLRELLQKIQNRESTETSEVNRLRSALAKAVRSENFEDAAEIRDQLSALEQRHV